MHSFITPNIWDYMRVKLENSEKLRKKIPPWKGVKETIANGDQKKVYTGSEIDLLLDWLLHVFWWEKCL